MIQADTAEGSEMVDPTLQALQNLRSSLPDGYDIRDDFSIGMPEGMVPRQNRMFRNEKWIGPEMVIQSAFSVHDEFRCLMIYRVLPSGQGELFGYRIDGALGSPITGSEPYVAEGKEDIAEEQYLKFRKIVDFALKKIQPDCSLPD